MELNDALIRERFHEVVRDDHPRSVGASQYE